MADNAPPPAVTLAHELGAAGQALKALLSAVPPKDDDGELFHLRRIAFQAPEALKSSPPTLFHSKGVAAANLLWGATHPQPKDAPYRKGLWCPPANAVAVGVAMCDVNSPAPMPVPAVVFAGSDGEETMVLTLFCPDVPLGSLEHELFDPSVDPSPVQRYMLSTDTAPDLHLEEHARRTGDARRELAEGGLSKLPDFLLGGSYHLRRETVLPFLKLRRAQTEEEVALLRRLPSKLNFGDVKQNRGLLESLPRADETHSYRFEVVLQSSDTPFQETAARFTELAQAPVIAPLVDLLMLKSLPLSDLSKFRLPDEEMRFDGFVSNVRKREMQHAAATLPTTTRQYQDKNLATLDALMREGAQCIEYGSSTRLTGAVNQLFSDLDASLLETEFTKAGNATCEDDLRTLAKFLNVGHLILFSKLRDGLIESTTCCGHRVAGIRIGLDSLSRLCALPWVVHLVESHGVLSQRLPGSRKSPQLKLVDGMGSLSNALPAVTPALNVSKVDFERLLTGIEDVKTLVSKKRKREEEEGDGGARDDGGDKDEASARAAMEKAVDASRKAGQASQATAAMIEASLTAAADSKRAIDAASTAAATNIARAEQKLQALFDQVQTATRRLEEAADAAADAPAAPSAPSAPSAANAEATAALLNGAKEDIEKACGQAAQKGADRVEFEVNVSYQGLSRQLEKMGAQMEALTQRVAAPAPAPAPALAAGAGAAAAGPSSPQPPVPLPSGVAALGGALQAMRNTDAVLKRKMRSLIAA